MPNARERHLKWVEQALSQRSDAPELLDAMQRLTEKRMALRRAEEEHKAAVAELEATLPAGFSRQTLTRLYWATEVRVSALAESLDLSPSTVHKVAGSPPDDLTEPCSECGEETRLFPSGAPVSRTQARGAHRCVACTTRRLEREAALRASHTERYARYLREERASRRRAEQALAEQLAAGKIDAHTETLVAIEDPHSGMRHTFSLDAHAVEGMLS